MSNIYDPVQLGHMYNNLHIP